MRSLDSALFDAVKENKIATVIKLLKRGADSNAQESLLFSGYIKYQRSVLHAALRITDDRGFPIDVPENTEMVSALLGNGAKVNAIDTSKFTPLRLAALRGKRKTVHLLLDNGADINARDDQGQTPLMMAVRSGDILLLEDLLIKGADIDAQNDFGNTALMYAVDCLQTALETVPVLLRYGADVKLADRHGLTAVDWLANRLDFPNAIKVIEMLQQATLRK